LRQAQRKHSQKQAQHKHVLPGMQQTSGPCTATAGAEHPGHSHAYASNVHTSATQASTLQARANTMQAYATTMRARAETLGMGFTTQPQACVRA